MVGVCSTESMSQSKDPFSQHNYIIECHIQAIYWYNLYLTRTAAVSFHKLPLNKRVLYQVVSQDNS